MVNRGWKQSLTSLNIKIPKKPFKLKGINKNSPYFDKSFSEFSLEDQRKLKRLVLRAIITEQISPSNDNTSIYHIFERLNTGGTELKEQEIRNCVYHGKLNDLLNKLNEDKYWRLIYGVDQYNHEIKKMFCNFKIHGIIS